MSTEEKIAWARAVLRGEAGLPDAQDPSDLEERLANRTWGAIRVAADYRDQPSIELIFRSFLDDPRPEVASEALAVSVEAGQPGAEERALDIIRRAAAHPFVLTRAIETIAAGHPERLRELADDLRRLATNYPSATVSNAATAALRAIE